MTIVRWFLSRQVRLAVATRRHVAKLLAAQRDILQPQAISAVQEALTGLQTAISSGADKATLKAQMENLENVANKWLKPYPNAAWRENVEVFLVAIAVAMAIRTFFLQPFKIPTGSMQPTLYGVTHENLVNRPDVPAPGTLARFWDYWFNGVSYVQVTAKAGGTLERFDPPQRFLLFNLKQNFVVGGQSYTVWFPPDDLLSRAGWLVQGPDRRFYLTGREVKAGEDIIRLRVLAGDHLFVNRLAYNFCHPQRGDIIVFSTKGFERDRAAMFGIDPNQYYIKRLVGLGGETLRIGNDQHLIVNGRRLDSSEPHFENIYHFRPNAVPNEYFGHVFADNSDPARTPILTDASKELTIQTNHYAVMGDNTRNSLDSRYLGDFPRENVIGKASFVYWPIGTGGRFGFGYR